MRTFLCTTMMLLFISCGQNSNSPIEKVQPLPSADSFVIKFKTQNPDFTKNDLSLDAATKKFSDTVLFCLKHGTLINDLPMAIQSMKSAKDKNVIVHFQRWGSTFLENGQNISIDVFAIVDSSIAITLVQDRNIKYRIVEFSKAVRIDELLI